MIRVSFCVNTIICSYSVLWQKMIQSRVYISQRDLVPLMLDATYLNLLSATVIKHLIKNNLRTRRFIWLTCTNHSRSSREARAGTQGKTLETRAEVEVMQKCSLLSAPHSLLSLLRSLVQEWQCPQRAVSFPNKQTSVINLENDSQI